MINLKRKYIICIFAFLFVVVSGVSAFAEEKELQTEIVKEQIDLETRPLRGNGCNVQFFKMFSKSLGKEIKIYVILPPEYRAYPGKKYPILYALPPRGSSYRIFMFIKSISEILRNKPMIIAGFEVDVNLRYKGIDQFFFDEFIPLVDKYYIVNIDQRMLNGITMGGYGALNYMLAKPEMFISVSSVDGDWNKDEKEDMFKKIKEYAERKIKLPPVALGCRAEDGNVEANVEMKDFLEKNGFSLRFAKSAVKDSSTFWDIVYEEILDFHWKSIPKK